MLLTNRIVIIGKYFYWWLICVRHWALYKHDRIAIDKQLKFSYKQYYFISLLRKRLSTIRVLNSNRYIKWKLDNQAIKISCAFSKRNESTGVAFRKTDILTFQSDKWKWPSMLHKSYVLHCVTWCHCQHFGSIGLNNRHLLSQLMLMWKRENIKMFQKQNLRIEIELKKQFNLIPFHIYPEL